MTPLEVKGPCLNNVSNFPIRAFYDQMADTFIKDNMNIVEIGVFMGQSSIYLADRIKKKGLSNVKFYTVDHWSGSIEHINSNGGWHVTELDTNPNYLYDTFLNNVKGCGVEDVIVPVRQDSTIAASTFTDGFFDFIFIDASHDYENVKKDVNVWKPKLKTGGIISGDDYGPDIWAGVYNAINEIFGQSNVKTKGYSWYVSTNKTI